MAPHAQPAASPGSAASPGGSAPAAALAAGASLDLSWLDAPEADVRAAISRRRDEAPRWSPSGVRLVWAANAWLMFSTLAIGWFVISARVTQQQDDRIEARDLREMSLVTGIVLLWAGASWGLARWLKYRRTPHARLAEWRQTLTAAANGLVSQPERRVSFGSMMRPTRHGGYCHPRFVGQGYEYGTLTRRRPAPQTWQYCVVALPAPLPHFVCEAVGSGDLARKIPAELRRSQRLPLEGDFDRSHHLYVPAGSERDALQVLTPEVMAALVDHAPEYHVEVTGQRLVCFTGVPANFATPAPWRAARRLLTGLVPEWAESGERYRDERIPELNESPTVARMRAALERPEESWQPPEPRIDRGGQSLGMRDRRTGRRLRVGRVVGGVALWLRYAPPAVLRSTAVLTIVSGKPGG